jgi:hypothetical protein
MVRDDVWEMAWRGRRKMVQVYFFGQPERLEHLSGLEFLCTGCLEQRIGRTLVASDFTDALINRLDGHTSARLRNRLMAIDHLPPPPC